MAIKNLDRLRRKMARIPRVIRAAAEKDLLAGGNEMVRLAKSLLDDRTGTLDATIHATLYEDTSRVVVEAGGPATEKPVIDGLDASYNYAAAVELGTRKMAARPFFFPAYRAVKKTTRSRVSRAINKAAKAVAAGS